ncbi:MAG: hypothetical protein LBG44_04115 [Gemmatimonadota bacterium]|nr:hypothetical protein [Gemmatimonadota bacterium]
MTALMRRRPSTPGFQANVGDEPTTVLAAEQLRDGRVALGSRTCQPDGAWEPGELHLLDRQTQLDLASWLTPAVETGWQDTVRMRREETLRTAEDLYGEGRAAVHRLALDTLAEISPALLARAMILLANSIGPTSRERVIERLNETDDHSEELELRRRLMDENESFAYAIAAAALFDVLREDPDPEG